jgi:hypothetical protein
VEIQAKMALKAQLVIAEQQAKTELQEMTAPQVLKEQLVIAELKEIRVQLVLKG